MPRILRAVAAASLAVPAVLLAAAPAHAESATCLVTNPPGGKTLTITAGADWPYEGVGVDQDGNLQLDSSSPCLDSENPIPLAGLTSLVFQHQAENPEAFTFQLHRPALFASVVTSVHADASDRLSLLAYPETDATTILAVNGDTPALSLDGDAAAELLVDVLPASLYADLGTGADHMDLVGDGSNPFTTNTNISLREGDNILVTGDGVDQVWGGQNSDSITTGAGDDFADGQGGADFIDLGAGTDTGQVWSDADPDIYFGGAGEDTINVSNPGLRSAFTVGSPGGDGVAGENDGWHGFEAANSTANSAGLTVTGPASGSFTFTAGSDGSDVLVSGAANETFFANDLTDVVSYAASPSGVNVYGYGDEVDPDQATGHGFDDLFGVHNYIGSPGGDYFSLNTTPLTIRPGLGDDQLQTDGQTTLVAEPGPDGADDFFGYGVCVWDYSARTAPLRVSSNSVDDDGDPTANGGAGEGDDFSCGWLTGGSGGDTLVGGGSVDRFNGGPGNDLLVGRGGNDELQGGAGADTVTGSSGNDTLYGIGEADSLYGGSGEDYLDGGDGNDRLDGGLGDDDEYGRAGNDLFVEGATASENGSDLLVGDLGTDTVSYLGRTAGVALSNDGGWGDGAAGEGDNVGAGIEKLLGTNSADVISGGGLADWLYGYGGSDTLHGNAGNDTIDGGTAADKLYGDAGNDSLYAKDGTKDTVSGGTGTDKARRDTIDALLSIEGIL